VSSNERPPTRPGIPCLIPVRLDSGNETVDGVITRISEMAASISLEKPFAAASRVLARFRRPGDREEVEIAGSIIGFSREGGIWRGRPSLALRFDADLRHAQPVTDDLAPVAAPPRAEPTLPSQSPDTPAGGETPPSEPQPADLWEADAPIAEGDGELLSWPPDGDSEEPLAAESPIEIGEPLVSGTALPDPVDFDLFEGLDEDGGFEGEELDESTIDRLKHQMQRSERRILASLPVTFLSGGEEYHGLACNFSQGGLYMAAEALPKVGTIVHVVFPLTTPDGSDQEVEFNGVVRWFRRDRPDLNLPDGFGLQIVSFEEPEDRRLYLSFARSIMEETKD